MSEFPGRSVEPLHPWESIILPSDWENLEDLKAQYPLTLEEIYQERADFYDEVAEVSGVSLMYPAHAAGFLDGYAQMRDLVASGIDSSVDPEVREAYEDAKDYIDDEIMNYMRLLEPLVGQQDTENPLTVENSWYGGELNWAELIERVEPILKKYKEMNHPIVAEVLRKTRVDDNKAGLTSNRDKAYHYFRLFAGLDLFYAANNSTLEAFDGELRVKNLVLNAGAIWALKNMRELIPEAFEV